HGLASPECGGHEPDHKSWSDLMTREVTRGLGCLGKLGWEGLATKGDHESCSDLTTREVTRGVPLDVLGSGLNGPWPQVVPYGNERVH
ncbi:hypothetical protein HAX54_015495, partial [Datura stramonium]|nr:hypothetical protein [Datura stramonium]